MKTHKIFYVIILFVLLSFSVFAQINSLEIDTDIEGEYAYSNYIINVVNSESDCLESLKLNIPYESKIYFVKDGFGDLDYEINDQNLKINLTKCIETERTIFFKTRSKQIDKMNGDNYRYIFDFYPTNKINKFQHVLKLPILEKNVYSVEPATEPFIQNEKLIFSWTSYNVSDKNVFIVKFKQQGLNNYIYCIFIFIVFIILLIFLIKRSLKFKKRKLIEKNLEILNEKEKKIVKEILKKEGINQSILKNKLNLTKSNLSKILVSLQLRGIIIKKSEGKINKLYLGDKLKKL